MLSAINAPANNMKIIEKLISDYILPSDKKGIICEISQIKKFPILPTEKYNRDTCEMVKRFQYYNLQ